MSIPVTQSFPTAGTFTFVPPPAAGSTSGAYTLDSVSLWGGGGGAGGTAAVGGGGGGAGGQFSKSTSVSVTSLSAVTLVVAATSAGGAGTANGTVGNDSTWASTTVVAKGGAAGLSFLNGATAGAGSTTGGVGGTVNRGGNASAGTLVAGNSGSGGGGAGTTGAGGDAVTSTPGTGTSLSGGTGGAGRTTGGNGNAGATAGGGGSGGYDSTGTTSRTGGAGAIGRAELAYTVDDSSIINGAISVWKFDDLNDAIGANTLTGTGSPTFSTGKVGNAMYLNGSGQRANMPTGFLASFSTGFTAMGWVYQTTANQWAQIFSAGTGTTNYVFITPCSGTPGTGDFAANSFVAGSDVLNAGETNMHAQGSLSTGVWYHVALVYTGTQAALYLNGVCVAGMASSGVTGATFVPSQLGSTNLNYMGKSQFADPDFSGRLDDWVLYAFGATPWQMQAYYNAGAGVAYPFSTAPSSATPSTATRLAYCMITFDGGTEVLVLLDSPDYGWFRNIPVTYTPTGAHTCRDPDAGYWRGNWYFCHTTGSFGNSTSFDIARATNTQLSAWSFLVTVDCSSVTTGAAPRTWAPQFVKKKDSSLYLDANGRPLIMFAGCTNYNGGTNPAFKIYLVTFTADDLSTSTIAQVTGTAIVTASSGSIDACPVYDPDDTTFRLLMKDETSKVVYIVSSSSVGSGYDTTVSSDVCGSGVEGASVVYSPNGNGLIRVYVDRYLAGSGMAFVEASTWAGLSGLKASGISSDVLTRHGSVFAYQSPVSPAHQLVSSQAVKRASYF